MCGPGLWTAGTHSLGLNHAWGRADSTPQPLLTCPAPQLFDHIVDCIVDFQRKQGLSGQSLPLGFTFSFPCRQLGLDQVRKGGKPSLRAFHPHTLHGVSRRLGSSFQCPGLGGGGGRWRHHWAEPTLSLNFPRRAVPGWMGVVIWPGIQDHGEAWGEGHGHLWGLPVGRGVEPGLGLGIWEQCRPRSRLPSRHAACHLQHQCSGLVSCGERRLFQSLEGACACMGSFALFPLASVPLSVPGSGLGA